MLNTNRKRVLFACIDLDYVRVFDQVLVGNRFIVLDRCTFRTLRRKDFVKFLARSRPLI